MCSGLFYGEHLGRNVSNVETNDYLYGGKELQQRFGVNLYDSGARFQSNTGAFTSPDPLAEKYYSISPYAYCAGNPVNLVDPEGRMVFPKYPMPILPIYTAQKVCNYINSSRTIKTFIYSVKNPVIAFEVGSYKEGRRNISTTASNYAINLSKSMGKEYKGTGNTGNALRHTIWQGIITNKYGKYHAEQIGIAHENRTDFDLSEGKTYSNPEDADTSADLKNNTIGQEIGSSNYSSTQELVSKVLDYTKENGLWEVEGSDGKYRVVQKKISEEEWRKAMEELNQLNQYGKKN